MKKLIQIFLFGINLSIYSQDKCKTCDSLLNKSKNDYDYLSYEKYYKSCLITDTFYYDGSIVSKNKNTSVHYIVTNKNYCNNYYSIKKFETKTKEKG